MSRPKKEESPGGAAALRELGDGPHLCETDPWGQKATSFRPFPFSFLFQGLGLLSG